MTWLEPYLPQLLLAWSIQWIGVLSPGPGVALILSVAVLLFVTLIALCMTWRPRFRYFGVGWCWFLGVMLPMVAAAVSLAASVADALAQGEYIIDIFAAGPELYVFRAGRHTAHFENVLEILACIDACRENPFQTVSPAVAEELGNISAAICVLLDWDSSRRELARTVLEAGSSLKVLIARDGAPTEPLDETDGDISQYSLEQIRKGGLETL